MHVLGWMPPVNTTTAECVLSVFWHADFGGWASRLQQPGGETQWWDARAEEEVQRAGFYATREATRLAGAIAPHRAAPKLPTEAGWLQLAEKLASGPPALPRARPHFTHTNASNP